MADLTITASEIAATLEQHLSGFRPEIVSEQVGQVIEVGDGIAHIEGLPGAAVNEILEFPGGLLGLALNLDEDEIGAVVLGDVAGIEAGDAVRATGRILSVPVGDALLGRVVDTLGRPLDGKGPVATTATRRMELPARASSTASR